MQTAEFLSKLNSTPEKVEFEDTMNTVEANFDFTPTAFHNGELYNSAEQNQGSCKLLALAQQLQLSQEQTLACFGRYYREDVLQNPTGTDHQNIRNFINSGWDEVRFEGAPLKSK